MRILDGGTDLPRPRCKASKLAAAAASSNPFPLSVPPAATSDVNAAAAPTPCTRAARCCGAPPRFCGTSGRGGSPPPRGCGGECAADGPTGGAHAGGRGVLLWLKGRGACRMSVDAAAGAAV